MTWRGLALPVIWAVALLALPPAARAITLPGYIQLNNLASNQTGAVDAPVFDVDGLTRLSGYQYFAQLYAGATNTEPNQFHPLAIPASFGTNSAPGYFDGGVLQTDDAPGTPLRVQVRVWNSNCDDSSAATFEEALQNGCPVALSDVLTLQTGTEQDPAILLGLDSLQLTFEPGPPVFLRHPESQTVGVGESVTFIVEASGIGPLRYQWQKFVQGPLLADAGSSGWEDLPGQTNALLTLLNVPSAGESVYSVLAVNPLGSSRSSNAVLSLGTLPEITLQPVTQVSDLGGSVGFFVEATGTGPLQFQWRRNGVALPGETSSGLFLSEIQLRDGGNYSVLVANGRGVVKSQPAQLLLAVPPLQAGDNFADRVPLLDPLGTITGNNLGATHEPAEPDHAGIPGSNSVWYTWVAQDSGIARFATRGSTFDTLLAVYTGETVGALDEVASDDDRGQYHTCEVFFNAEAGTSYQIAVDGYGEQTGSFLLDWELEITPERLPVITGQPRSLTVRAGGRADLVVEATGENLTYQWYFFDTPLQNATRPSLTLRNVQRPRVGRYTVEVRNNNRGVRSLPAHLQIGPVREVQSEDKAGDLFLKQTARLGPVFRFGLGAGAGGTGNSVTAIPVTQGSAGYQLFSNQGSTTEDPEPLHCLVITKATEFLPLTAEQDGVFVLDTIGTDFDTTLTVYTGPAKLETTFDYALLVQVGCDDNHAPDGFHSQLVFPASAGSFYYAVVDGVGSTGTIQLNWRLANPLILSNSTARQFARVSHDFALAVSTPGTSYQWHHDSVPMPGATNPTLYLCNLQLWDAGQYSLNFKDLAGVTTTTSAAWLVAVRLTPKLVASPGTQEFWLDGQATDGIAMDYSGTLKGTEWTNTRTLNLPNTPFGIRQVPGSPVLLRHYRVRLLP